MKKLLAIVIMAIMIMNYGISTAESEEGDIFINSILDGVKEGDMRMMPYGDYGPDGNGTGKQPYITVQSETGSSGWQTTTMTFHNWSVPIAYKYRVVGDGSGPTYVWFAGSAAVTLNPSTGMATKENEKDYGDTILDIPEYQSCNMVVFSSGATGVEKTKQLPNDPSVKKVNKKPGDVYLGSANKGLSTEYREIYANTVTNIAFNSETGLFPKSTETMLVGHSGGGDALDKVYEAIKQTYTTITTKAAAFFDGLHKKGYTANESTNGYLTKSLEEDNIPIYNFASTDKNRAKDSKGYIDQGEEGNVHSFEITAKNDAGMTNTGASSHMAIAYASDIAKEAISPDKIFTQSGNDNTNKVTALEKKQTTLLDKLKTGTETKIKTVTNWAKSLTDTASKIVTAFNKTSNTKTNTGTETTTTKTNNNIYKKTTNNIKTTINKMVTKTNTINGIQKLSK